MATIVGFGSQGQAWAEILSAPVYVRSEGSSFRRAHELGFSPRPLSELAKSVETEFAQTKLPVIVALLCQDRMIGTVYRKYLAEIKAPLTLVIAHGFSVYAKDLIDLRPGHEVALLAPKAIGPELRAAYFESSRKEHQLSAAFFAPPSRESAVRELAHHLGFQDSNLIPASFEMETIGDLLSEQGLLCGGVFTLMEWTCDFMRKAGVSEALIKQECFRELELIARILSQHGLEGTRTRISEAARIGAEQMKARLEASDAPQVFRAQLETVLSGKFVESVMGASLEGKPQHAPFKGNRFEESSEKLAGELI